ncbi:hypothetical protein, partial [Niastella caeni]|uniref:hypothetical protein n=1 Tax=Niastella caeni TaxID=2569763 RepID=UPI001AA04145
MGYAGDEPLKNFQESKIEECSVLIPCLVLKKLYTLNLKCMVENDKEQQLIGRYSTTGFYDKRFIAQV